MNKEQEELADIMCPYKDGEYKYQRESAIAYATRIIDAGYHKLDEEKVASWMKPDKNNQVLFPESGNLHCPKCGNLIPITKETKGGTCKCGWEFRFLEYNIMIESPANNKGGIMDKPPVLPDEEIAPVRFQASCSEGIGKDSLGQYHLSEFGIKDLITKVAKAQRDDTCRKIVDLLEKLDKHKVFGFEDGTLLIYKEDWQEFKDMGE